MTIYVADMGSQNTVNFAKLGASGQCAGVILRATRSNQEVDPLYAARRAQARMAGLLVAAYAFNTGEAPSVQVARFMSVAKPAADEAGYLDLERNPSGGQMTLGMTIEWGDRYCQAVGRACGLYSGNVIKELMPQATDAQRDFFATHFVPWGCEYGPRWRNVDVNGHPLPWPKLFLWQFTGDGVGPEPHTLPGLENGADISSFDGTIADLREAWPLPAIAQVAA